MAAGATSPLDPPGGTELVLDFVNNPVDIQDAFLQYYTEAHVETATDPNLVHQRATKRGTAVTCSR